MNKDLDKYIEQHTKNRAGTDKTQSFTEYLYELMDKYGYKNSADLYNKANISRQLWSSIISSQSNSSLNKSLKIVFALGVDTH